MLTIIGDLVRNLVVIIFLNALLEMMLPQGGFHRYIRLVTGLIVILMVVGTIAALLGRVPSLEPVFPARPAAERAAVAEGQNGELAAAYHRQVLRQHRAALEDLLCDEIAASGEWRLVEMALVLEEDYNSSSFGTPLKIDLLVEAAAGESGRIAPVSIAPVSVERAERAGDPAGPPPRLLELEQTLADLLGLSPAQVTVTVCE